MDSFLALDSKLIKVEVEENKNHRCIVCKAEFLTRIERNDHLETHFVHRNCEHCSKPVIIIGDLEFELHRPTHCNSTIETMPAPTIAIPDDDNFADDRTLAIEFLDDTDDKYDSKTLLENLESPRMTKRSKPKVNYNENDEIVNTTTNKREKSQRKSKKSNVCRASAPHKTEHIEIDANLDFVPNDDFNSCTISKSNSESEDDVVKEMDVALKKRQRKYNRLPKTVPCTMCDMMFGTERTLKIHMNQVHGIKEKYICPICTREFKNGGNLKQHIETHSDYKRFICNYCGKGFHLPYNLKEHMNTHTGARPYKCETCGKTFGRNTLRTAHMRIHTGEKPYKCTEENCDRAYAYQTDLKRHRRSIHGIITKTFTCPICSKVFYENKFLTKHLNVHQGNA